MEKNRILIVLIILVALLSGCTSIKKAGINMISDVMAGEGSGELFTGDDDPELVKDALPFILKMYEMLAGENPDDPALLLATGSTFIMYSNIFIQTEADMLSDDEYEEQFRMLHRSKKMYRRGTGYVFQSLEASHPGFGELIDQGRIDEALSGMTVDDVPALYWAASGMMGEFSTDPFDFELGPQIYKPVAFVYKALELDESFNNGSIHDLLILVNSSLPQAMMFKAGGEEPTAIELFTKDYYKSAGAGTQAEIARFHFERSLEISGGGNAGTYISLASSVCVNEQNLAEFEELLTTALEIDPEAFPEMRLAGIIYREKAQWLLDHKSDYFLLDFDEGDF
ncbi:MAG: TRAP transporter TatT component family protein [Spirochaetales bacterium]|nr:TRAP transporter TatT component family protein [Spirochaetales bacterium]